MRARYAHAIRQGILYARLTDYGSLDDQYYDLNRTLRNKFFDMSEQLNAEQAFDRTYKKLMDAAISSMSVDEKEKAAENFALVRIMYYETRKEKYLRELVDEVRDLKERLLKLESNA